MPSLASSCVARVPRATPPRAAGAADLAQPLIGAWSMPVSQGSGTMDSTRR